MDKLRQHVQRRATDCKKAASFNPYHAIDYYCLQLQFDISADKVFRIYHALNPSGTINPPMEDADWICETFDFSHVKVELIHSTHKGRVIVCFSYASASSFVVIKPYSVRTYKDTHALYY